VWNVESEHFPGFCIWKVSTFCDVVHGKWIKICEYLCEIAEKIRNILKGETRAWGLSMHEKLRVWNSFDTVPLKSLDIITMYKCFNLCTYIYAPTNAKREDNILIWVLHLWPVTDCDSLRPLGPFNVLIRFQGGITPFLGLHIHIYVLYIHM